MAELEIKNIIVVGGCGKSLALELLKHTDSQTIEKAMRCLIDKTETRFDQTAMAKLEGRFLSSTLKINRETPENKKWPNSPVCLPTT